MKTENALVVLLVLLVLVSAVQAVELVTIKNSGVVSDSTVETTVKEKTVQQAPQQQNLPAGLQDLPTQVGGC